MTMNAIITVNKPTTQHKDIVVYVNKFSYWCSYSYCEYVKGTGIACKWQTVERKPGCRCPAYKTAKKIHDMLKWG